MSINVRLETETGEPIEELYDPQGRVKQLLPDWRDETSTCLRFVDLYGNTVFNHLQIDVLITELETSIESITDPNVAAHGRAIVELAKKCKFDHTYLKFVGD
jgi:hypothetical protein